MPFFISCRNQERIRVCPASCSDEEFNADLRFAVDTSTSSGKHVQVSLLASPLQRAKKLARYERLSCSGAIEVLPCKPKGDWKFTMAELVNCSRHGIAMHFAEPMLPNEQFLVKLKINAVQLLVFQVRWCMGEAPNYVIGAGIRRLFDGPVQ